MICHFHGFCAASCDRFYPDYHHRESLSPRTWSRVWWYL